LTIPSKAIVIFDRLFVSVEEKSRTGRAEVDPVTQLITAWKIPIGAWGKAFFGFLTTNFEWFFDGSDAAAAIKTALGN
jgi:hypothetical protein